MSDFFNLEEARPTHNKLLEMIDNGEVCCETMLKQLLAWLPEDDVKKFANDYEYLYDADDFEGTGMSEADIRDLSVDEMADMGIYTEANLDDLSCDLEDIDGANLYLVDKAPDGSDAVGYIEITNISEKTISAVKDIIKDNDFDIIDSLEPEGTDHNSYCIWFN